MKSLIVLSLLCSAGTAFPRMEDDQICRQLFDSYITTNNMTSSDVIDASMTIIASRGRTNGFWRTVVDQIDKKDRVSELRCVEIVGKMLSHEARWSYPIPGASSGGQFSVSPVKKFDMAAIDALLSGVRNRDRLAKPTYLRSLVSGRVKEGLDTYREILKTADENSPLPETKFLAATGLAMYGDQQGYESLISSIDGLEAKSMITIPPLGCPSRDLDQCSLAVLRHLTGLQEYTTATQFRTWLQKHKDSLPQGQIWFRR